MLNSADPYQPLTFSIAEKAPNPQEVQQMETAFRTSFPSGATPLTRHLVNIQPIIRAMAPSLQGRKVAIVLTTDGLPSGDTNENDIQVPAFLQALQSFVGLPVWIVVRLCTDDERVFEFYNTLDTQVNLDIDVLDDLVGEATEVYLHNPWLTYSLSLHRMRELGFPEPALDAIDEHTLSLPELHSLCRILFGIQFPDPCLDWIGFLNALITSLGQEQLQWNPVMRRVTPWIDIARLQQIYQGNRPLPPAILNRIPVEYRVLQVPQPQQARNPMSNQAPPPPMNQQATPVPPQPSFPSQPPPPQASTQQSAPPPPPQSTAQSPPQVPAAAGDRESTLKAAVMQSWALQPPTFQTMNPLGQLLATLQDTFPPKFNTVEHDYYKKFKPFSPDALRNGDANVLKRGTYAIP